MADLPIATQIVAVDDSLGVVLPDEIVARLGLRAGQTMEMTEWPGGITLQRPDPTLQATAQPA